jgi:hypothetical protein
MALAAMRQVAIESARSISSLARPWSSVTSSGRQSAERNLENIGEPAGVPNSPKECRNRKVDSVESDQRALAGRTRERGYPSSDLVETSIHE